MNNHSLSARLAIAFCGWLLARCGVEWHLGPAAGHNLRDKRGRFRPKDGGGYGLPREIPHRVADLLHDLGVTAEMYRTAAVPLVLPDDLSDVPALEVCLREWILRNMDHWVNGKGRSVWPVMQALMHTWALTLYKYKPPRRLLQRQAAIHDVGEDPPLSRNGTTLGTLPESETATQVAAGASRHNPVDEKGYLYHRDTDTRGEDLEFSESPCPCGSENTVDIPATAGGRRALPYTGSLLRGPPATIPATSLHFENLIA